MVIPHSIASRIMSSGISVLPAIPSEKRPALPGWRAFQSARPGEAQLRTWFAEAEGMCLVCGAVSGNVEMIDFDHGGELFPAWWETVEANRPGLFEKLVIEETPSGGYHVAYRCDAPVPGNRKLARRILPFDGPDPVLIRGKQYQPLQRNGNWQVPLVLIETRGEGGLFLCAPTPGYRLQQGDFSDLPVLSPEKREVLIAAAMSLDEAPLPATVSSPSGELSADRPGDDFNARADIRPVLERHGWTRVREGTNEHWRRPGKASGTSATLKDGVFYVFSSNAAPFDSDRGYSPFQAYALLEHGGDFNAAARQLREDGFGIGDDPGHGVDLSSFLANLPDPVNKAKETAPTPLSELFQTVTELDRPIIHGLLREGETRNVIASSKTGKSWLVMRLAISIASGCDWFGMPVEHGRVLHIDNELRLNTIVHRYRKVSEALKISHDSFSDNLEIMSLRGQLKDLNQLGAFFATLEPGRYKAIVLDAFYRTLPIGTDENDNGAIANLYNKLDWYASQLKCAFILIHHASKGNQAAKSVTDVGAGAGAQSRAADTHLVLRPHEQPDVAVLEVAVRSWPPKEPMCIRWEFPLWHEAKDLDPNALQGRIQERSSNKTRDWSVEEFITECVMPHDPCTQNKIIYEAGRLGLSERKTRELMTYALNENLLCRERSGSRLLYAAMRDGVSPGKAQLVTAALDKPTPESPADLAEKLGVSDRYIRQIRAVTEGSATGHWMHGEASKDECFDRN